MRTKKYDYINAIHKILLQHSGKDNAIKCKAIKEILANQGIIISKVSIGLYINKMVTEYSFPILSCENGYFWAKSLKEIQENINYLKSYVDSINQRIDILSQYIIGE